MISALFRTDAADLEAPAGRSRPAWGRPPVVGRFAGFPARSLDPLGSPETAEVAREIGEARAELEDARQVLIAAIEAALTRFEPAARRLLLAVKRSCFNGREIGRYRERAEWSALLEVSAPCVELTVALEARLRELEAELEALHRAELARERSHVLELARERSFLRGVAISRPGLVRKLHHEAPTLVASGFAKPPAKWEESLLRFATRAAVKLSANSTLTAWALGSVRAAPGPEGLTAVSVARREASLVRLDRPQLEQLQALLLENPAVRRCALVAWNDSVEEIEPGRLSFVRDGRWQLDAEAAELRYVEPVRVKVSPDNPYLDAARAMLGAGALPYGDVVARLACESAPAAAAAPSAKDGLEQLLALGVLLLLPPWPTSEPCLERRIAGFLDDLAADEPTLRPTAEAVTDLVAREEEYASTSAPAAAVAGMAEMFTRSLSSLAPFVGHEGKLTPRARFFEDVLLEPAHEDEDDRGVFEVSASCVGDVLRVVRLVSRFDSLFNLRHDVLHTLAAWWRTHAPARRRLSFDELARGFAPVWRAYPRFHEEAKRAPLSTFDPLSTPALSELAAMRRSAAARVREEVGRSPGKDRLDPAAFAALLAELPARYAPIVGSSVFLQPTDPSASTWVLNNVTEGTGRYLSRVVPALDAPRRERFLDHLIARSTIEVDGEEADLLEVKHPWQTLLRAHPPQAARVLQLRGLHLDLPRDRTVGLDELAVEADLEAESFRLVDGTGRRLLPASLSTLADSGLPNRLRLLLMFGPGETRGVFPFPWSERRGDHVVRNRLTCGPVVTRRRSWDLAVADLREGLAGATEHRAFAVVDRWRHDLGLPNEGFYHELASCGKEKPQFVRFDSPSLCRLFMTSLSRMDGGLVHFVESLPSPTDFPRDWSGERRGFELLIDELAIHDLGGNSSASRPDRAWETPSLRKER